MTVNELVGSLFAIRAVDRVREPQDSSECNIVHCDSEVRVDPEPLGEQRREQRRDINIGNVRTIDARGCGCCHVVRLHCRPQPCGVHWVLRHVGVGMLVPKCGISGYATYAFLGFWEYRCRKLITDVHA